MKKKEVKNLLKRQRRFFAIILFFLSAVIGVLQFTMAPKILQIYREFNALAPFVVKNSFYITGAIMAISTIIALYLLIASPDYRHLNESSDKYDEEEMIKISEIPEINYASAAEPIMMILIGIIVSYIILSTILPLYNFNFLNGL